MHNIEIIKCDFQNPAHAQAVIDLLNVYSMDKMGDQSPLPMGIANDIIDGLSSNPTSFVLFAAYNQEMVGMTVCFIGFSTFKAKKLINIHDIIVLPSYRGRGIGRKLMKEVEVIARGMDCCKITLEVRQDNFIAQTLYKDEGYIDSDPPMLFWHKPIVAD